MKRKGWLIPIIVFFTCMGALFIYQQNQFTTSLATTSDMPPILWSFKPDIINRIIVYDKGSEVEAVKKDLVWELTSDKYKKANDVYIHNIISDFKEPILLSVVNRKNTPLDEYGIDNYSKRLSMYDTNDKEYTLICGNEASDTTYYVYSPLSDTIYTMSKSVFDNITSHPIDWRNLNYLSFDKKATSKITLRFPDSEHTIKVNVENETPSFSSETLSNELVNDLILFLESTRIKKFITDSATDTVLTTYGFNNPIMQIMIYPSDEGTPTVINMGSTSQDENLSYISLGESKAIFAIPYFNLTPPTPTPDNEKSEETNTAVTTIK